MKEPHLIIFDCDGTIVDSEGLIVTAMVLAFEQASLQAPSSNDIRRVIGLSLPIAIEALGVEANEALIDKLAEGYKQSYTHLRDQLGHPEPMFDGAIELIHKLASVDNFILGIATGKSMKGVQGLLKRFDLKPYFQTIQTADNAPSKPHPAMISQALRETGIEPQRSVMIGDTTFDMEMARNAGIDAIGVTWGHHEREDLLAFSPEYIIDEFHQLEQTIADSFASSQ